ncbi:hypothetical protein COCSUDRAFT_83567 [Coccomyxa subellipsoidea C-169]|uniref:LYR motif-containing protein 9 n=1 Tax=Coccomyxa subellipsoidea (strain C-169) TaxID=574566 RepID=I0YM97_COCSC|nr:hypothetical protein COCSUDRAFT_83567 [Coccomyxa subellipsoidea C-169]EIE19516.1 hypothetical protein COCSUDRAFT_83567 [Coccomyxa subellipsoidea C-169]|eukprot:XP_005644060.1 hypothetical protein COCSUDRAFT_83567 [Coccomyxa subellipsoidea C-169]
MGSQQALALYRELLRNIRKLPRNSRQYYRQNVKGGFQNHNDEIDPERLQQLLEGARKDADFILNKYVGSNQGGSTTGR